MRCRWIKNDTDKGEGEGEVGVEVMVVVVVGAEVEVEVMVEVMVEVADFHQTHAFRVLAAWRLDDDFEARLWAIRTASEPFNKWSPSYQKRRIYQKNSSFAALHRRRKESP